MGILDIMINAPNIQKLYDNYINVANDLNRNERYKGKEEYYHASSAFSCRRKLYFETVLVADRTNPPNDSSSRKMRLGTIFHNEMEKCFDYYNNGGILYTKGITSSNTKGIPRASFSVYQEKEIIIDFVNVRGYYDLVLQMDSGEVYLYDYKTMGSFPWKIKFGNKPVFKYTKPPKKSFKYEFQLGTYGYAIKKQFGRLDGMYLVYYNKDTSVMRQVPVDLSYTEKAIQFWKEVNSEHKLGMPKLENGLSPVESWECSYCQFKDLCQKTD